MENSGFSEFDGEKTKKSTLGEPVAESHPSAPPADADAENPSSSSAVMSSIVSRWEREDLLKKGTLVLRAFALVFSLISFVVMASNNHGDWRNFEKYEEYRYCLAIAIFAFLYTGMQISLKMYQFSTGRDLIPRPTSSYLDFAGDQVVAYLLISAVSAAASLTNRMREGSDNVFTDGSAASISMAFFAFMSLALSAIISGFKLSHESYI